ncbi:MAG: ABC transporter ATP-binding protein [Ktedonobacterales bacterium]
MDITISDLTKVYRGNVHALNGLNLTIPSGMFGLVGPNGAGKTTLMHILAGILHPTSGTVRIGDREIHSEGDRTYVKRMLGYLPQELGVYPDLSAREFLDYIAILKGLDDHQTRRRRVAEVIDVVSLADVASRKLKTFSGGMKRRVSIAQALLNDPQLLIVDEPTAGLDPEERIRFRNLLADLGGNRTVLLSTHIVEDIAQTSQNLAAITGGRVIFQGTIAGLIDAARGHVWNITLASGVRPEGDVTVVSTLTQGTSVQYRVVGEPTSALRALPVDPSLEDGYVWLMRERRAPSLALS